jgi:hypothetical protein
MLLDIECMMGIVIPAKAGISLASSQGYAAEIPACAGMTR